MINYRYNICEKLGEGGSGEVFRVADALQPGQQYAVKVLHGDIVAAAETAEAFRNEVSALMNLAHPNLTRIVDFGVVKKSDPPSLEGRSFIVMELVRGRASLNWIEGAQIKPEDRLSLLEALLLQALSALSYVHRNGIIHFDIKPENLSIVGEYVPSVMPLVKLMDFGFSKRADEVGNVSVRGTLQYTAPELVLGATADHRVDVYSLGATFFHIIEGRCPHEASEVVELAKQIVNDPVRFNPSAWVGLEPLQHIVAKMLEKDPAERVPSANEAAIELVRAHLPAKEMFKTYFGVLQQPPLVGRAAEITVLENVLGNLAARAPETPTSLSIIGSEGIGKSSLLREAVKHARMLGITVSEDHTLNADVPFGAIERVILHMTAAARCSSNESRDVVQKYAQLLHLSDASVEHPALDWVAEREKFIELLARYVNECAVHVPTVIVMDDVDQSDPLSVAVLRMVVRNAQAGSLLVLTTASGSEGMIGENGRQIRLRELPVEDVQTLARFVLDGASYTDAVAGHLTQLYGGNPTMITEALLAAKQVLTEHDVAGEDAAEGLASLLEARLPRDIEDFLLDRYKRLTKEHQVLLSTIACFQNPAPVSVLMNVLPFQSRRTMDLLRYLELDGLVTSSAGERTVGISMRRLKDAVYRSLGDERVQVHTMIAAGLEARDRPPTFNDLQELGFQFMSCGEMNKASFYYERAGDEGLRLFALHRAMALLRDALNALPDGEREERRQRLVLKLARAMFEAEMYREAIAAAEELLDGSVERSILFSARKLMGLAFSRLGETDEARRYLTAALGLAAEESEQVPLRQELIGLEIAAGRFAEAEEACKEQIARSSQLHNTHALAASFTDLGIAVFFMGRYDEAVRCFSEAQRHYEALHEPTKVINSMNNIGNALSANGKFAEAINYWDKALHASRQFGTANQQAQILNNLGVASYNLRDYDKAKEYYLRAQELYERIDSHIGIAYAQSNIGEVQLAVGDIEGAIESWQSAKRLYAAMETLHGHVECCIHLAGAYGRLKDETLMAAELEEARMLTRQGNLDAFTPKLLFLQGQLLMLRQEFVSARQQFQEASAAYEKEPVGEPYLHAVVKAAECEKALGYHVKAVEMLNRVVGAATTNVHTRIFAEAMLLLGEIAVEKPEVVTEKAIVYFKRGLDAITKEPVGETTWRLAFALAREYHERGQSAKTREYLMKTKLVVQFFLSQFKSPDMKQRYLKADQKEQVLAAIEAFIHQ